MQRWIGLVLLCGTVMSVGTAGAQTDVGLSAYGAFTGTTNYAGTKITLWDQGGGLIEVRHIRSPNVGFEATYAFHRADQRYDYTFAAPVCGFPCAPAEVPKLAANMHELTVDYVGSIPFGAFRFFALAGGGVVIAAPVGGQASTTSQTKGAFVYGAGFDWLLTKRLGVRAQCRGNVYKAPELSTLFADPDKLTQTLEPALGIFLRL